MNHALEDLAYRRGLGDLLAEGARKRRGEWEEGQRPSLLP